ncbi:MAG TPA: efflux RND transporter permease subunit [Candidatus Binataceae bacterium]|nr:efflux RND transporter permease subunit [Candidatus Binataceae bacterium]
MNTSGGAEKLGLTARFVDLFLGSNLSMLLLLASLAAGVVALWVTPREEDPQISVPLADIIVQMPGASAAEVENLVTSNLEKRLWEMEGVRHLYSVSRPGMALVTVRFRVGYDKIRSLVQIYNKLESNRDAVPPGVSGWIVKPVGIDDVPILTVTLWSATHSDAALRRVADEILHRMQEVPDTGRSFVVGGRPRQVRVLLDPERLAGHGLAPLEIARALRGADANLRAGSFAHGNREYVLDSGPFLTSSREVANLVVAVRNGHPVYLREVAQVMDGPAEPAAYTAIGFGPARERLLTERGQLKLTSVGEPRRLYPAVTLAFAKRHGTNAVAVAEGLIARVEALKGVAIPSDVGVLVTRNYGETADEKVNELVRELMIAVAIIVGLLAFSLGVREALIVAIAVPITLAITLVGNLLAGYTINRVTLFALILSLGLLVDDPIVDVENIHRHFRLGDHPPREATLIAVDEVRPPTILATFTVIASFIPMLFVTGMMGPYMRPMPFNVPLAMLMSLVVAFTITPWAAYRLLRREYAPGGDGQQRADEGATVRRWYGAILRPLLESRRRARLFLFAMGGAFALSILLVVSGLVPVKMLPFDNKNELQLVIDMPEGTPLEATDAAVRDFDALLARVPEVTSFESYSGEPSPFDFNGMVRHYYLRRAPWQADIRVNLAPKGERAQSSHQIALRIRPPLEAIAREHGAKLKIVEMPPGPPVLETIVAEIYGPPEAEYAQLIAYGRALRRIFARTGGLVDTDDFSVAAQPRVLFVLDREKAALHGVSTATVARTLGLMLGGDAVATVHTATERNPLAIELRMPRAARSSLESLAAIRVRGADGAMVPLGELGGLRRTLEEQPIYRKDLRPVAMVMADTAGVSPVNEVLWLQRHTASLLPAGYTIEWSGEGEWNITLTVFRDLGIAFGAALFFIYVLLVAQTESLAMPLIIMAAIPLTMVGIMPGFFILDLLTNRPVAGYPDPTFFTATAMIGMIALAGIVVRNSIILIDFIHHGLARGLSLEEAILEAGAIRLRPIALTAGAAMLGSAVITLDPIFSGLAWSFIFGIFASTAFTLIVVPLLYYLVYHRRGAPGQGAAGADG